MGQTGSATDPGTRPPHTAAVLAVDYLIHHRKANGTTTAKTFKLTTKSLGPGERMTITRSHSFKPITTRRYYPRVHAVQLQVNGRRLRYAEFQLAD